MEEKRDIKVFIILMKYLIKR